MMDCKKSFLLLACAFGLLSNSGAQQASPIEVVRYDNEKNTINFFRIQEGHQVAFGDQGAEWLKNSLQLSAKDEFKLLSRESDKIGMEHYRFQQVHDGIPVEETMYIVHCKNGQVKSANGEYGRHFPNSSQASVSASEAIQAALNSINANTYKWELANEEVELRRMLNDASATYYPKGELVFKFNPETHRYALCYKFDIYAHQPLSRDFVYVDAANAEVLSKSTRLHYADSVGTGETRYSGTVPVTTDYSGSFFKLSESGRGMGIVTRNMNNGTTYGSAVDFTHPDNNWDSLGVDELAIDAHFGAEATYDYLMNVQGRNGIDDNGMILYSYVHYDNNFSNAFWDGQRMTYGDGDTSIGALVSPEICGHEIGHGLGQFTAQFSMNSESRALGESFSDILGALVESYLYPSRNDSLIYNTGDQVTGSITGMRNFIDPDLTSNPDTYEGQNWDFMGFDNHGNGVVQDHWFYILSEGLSGMNDNNDAYNVSGIGRNKAGDIAYRNLTVYMTPNAGFEEARFYAIESARDLFGGCSNEEIQTTNAWYAVGVGDEYNTTLIADFSFDVDVCADPVNVQFNNLSSAAVNYTWDFGDGMTSTVSSPTHTYSTDGTYTVKLIVTGCDMISQDSVISVDAFTIDNNMNCDSVVMPLNGNISSANCFGLVYDHGGKNGDVVSNTNASFTIQPTGAKNVTLRFSKFDYQGFTDAVTVYDGFDINSPIIAEYNFFNTPGDTVLTSSGGSLTIQERTGFGFPGFPSGEGFEAKWSCEETTGIGVNEIESGKSVVLFPNPNNGLFRIQYRGEESISRIQVMNILGEVVFDDSNLYESNGMITIDLGTEIKTGIYLVLIHQGEKISNEKMNINR